MGVNIVPTIVLLLLNFLGALALESKLTAYYKLELFVIGLLIVFGVLIVAAEYFGTLLAWRLSTVYFSLSTLNLCLLFLTTHQFVLFGVALVVNLIGLLRSVAKLDEHHFEAELETSLETYEEEPPIISATPEIVKTLDGSVRLVKGRKKRRSRKK